MEEQELKARDFALELGESTALNAESNAAYFSDSVDDPNELRTWADKIMRLAKSPQSKLVLDVLHRLANSPTTSPEILDILSKCDVPGIVEAVAANHYTPESTLTWLLQHPCPEVRAGLVDNPNLPRAIIERLAHDEHVDVRLAVAENHNVAREILELLTEDENPFVETRAQETLSRIVGPSSRPKISTTTVLVAEDDEFVRTVLKLYMKQFPDYEVIGDAADGAAAVNEVVRRRPDIVLMDIGLPGMDGIQATINIKNTLPETKIIMVTSHQEEEDIIAAFRAGADGYYLKTSSNKDLNKAIKTVLSGGHWIDPGIASAVLRQCIRSVRPTQMMNLDNSQNPVDVLLELVRKLSQTNRVAMAVSVCNAAIYLAQNMYGESSQQARECLVLLGDLYYLKEDYRESETAYLVELMKEINQEDQSKDLSDIDRSVFFLAQLNEALKNYDQAELYYSWALRLRERLDNPLAMLEVKERINSLLGRQDGRPSPVRISEEAIHANLFL